MSSTAVEKDYPSFFVRFSVDLTTHHRPPRSSPTFLGAACRIGPSSVDFRAEAGAAPGAGDRERGVRDVAGASREDPRRPRTSWADPFLLCSVESIAACDAVGAGAFPVGEIMIVYTKNRRTALCDAGGKPQEPKVELAPMTRVEIAVLMGQPQAVDVVDSRFVYVHVLDAPFHDKMGWIPSAALSLYAQNKLTTLLGAPMGLTGNSYGGEENFWNGKPIMVSTPSPNGKFFETASQPLWGLVNELTQDATLTVNDQAVDLSKFMLWERLCPQCGHDRQGHRIVETKMAPKTVWIKPKITTTDEDQMGKATEALRKQMVDTPRESGTADDARLFHERLCKAMADPKCQGAAKQITQQQNKIMLGVLHVAESDNVYATTSSKSDIPLIKAICAELGFIFAPVSTSSRARSSAPAAGQRSPRSRRRTYPHARLRS